MGAGKAPISNLLLPSQPPPPPPTPNPRATKNFDPVSQAEKEASDAISRRVTEAVELLEKGRELHSQGDFNEALLYFTKMVENYKDFAFSEYGRFGRALSLYEVGDREEAIAEMEDISISLKGYPEIHAALAAALYADKHAKETKHGPPSLVSSLQQFITLS
ncbi:uncharacterized protein LOC133673568 isoform X2 [Populus nigra]|uniref:uncharacterized protein LOC133673568 isoform X2 n=1 Tax=Populus nigra TaxID=3691 RepID=UPI002B26AC4D|nr:uncharacterized protein LOC133673568 isoform X2 [Populus nigra]